MDAKQFASTTLQFLDRTSMAPHERQAFGAVESVLKQIASGALLIGKPQEEKPAAGPPGQGEGINE